MFFKSFLVKAAVAARKMQASRDTTSVSKSQQEVGDRSGLVSVKTGVSQCPAQLLVMGKVLLQQAQIISPGVATNLRKSVSWGVTGNPWVLYASTLSSSA